MKRQRYSTIEPKKKLTVTIDGLTLSKIKDFAKSENRSTSNYVENLFNNHIKQKTHEQKKE